MKGAQHKEESTSREGPRPIEAGSIEGMHAAEAKSMQKDLVRSHIVPWPLRPSEGMCKATAKRAQRVTG